MIPGALREAVARDGEQIVYVARERLLDTMKWLQETPGQEFDYLVDVTAVEFRARYDGATMLDRFREELVLPYVKGLRRLTPLAYCLNSGAPRVMAS